MVLHLACEGSLERWQRRARSFRTPSHVLSFSIVCRARSNVRPRTRMWYREDYLLGLITNGTSRAQWQKIELLGLRKYFDVLLVSGDLPWEKPDQNIFLEACKLLGVPPRNCIMVGDKLETDIKGGKEAELGGTVWIPLYKETEVSDLPDVTIDCVTELPEVLPNSPSFRRSAHAKKFVNY